MSKLEFNTNISNDIINSLNMAITSLNNAINAANQLNSPYHFSASAQISNLAPQIEEAKNQCNHLVNWLNQSTTAIKNTNESIIDNLNNTSTIHIKAPISIINVK